MVIGVGCGCKLKKEASPNPSCFHGPSTWPLSDLPRECGEGPPGRRREGHREERSGWHGRPLRAGARRGGGGQHMDMVERVEKFGRKNNEKEKGNWRVDVSPFSTTIRVVWPNIFLTKTRVKKAALPEKPHLELYARPKALLNRPYYIFTILSMSLMHQRSRSPIIQSTWFRSDTNKIINQNLWQGD